MTTDIFQLRSTDELLSAYSDELLLKIPNEFVFQTFPLLDRTNNLPVPALNCTVLNTEPSQTTSCIGFTF